MSVCSWLYALISIHLHRYKAENNGFSLPLKSDFLIFYSCKWAELQRAESLGTKYYCKYIEQSKNGSSVCWCQGFVGMKEHGDRDIFNTGF